MHCANLRNETRICKQIGKMKRNGNTQGIAALVAGMKISDAITRLEGIQCNGRGTSCPDQLARALKKL